MIWEWIKRMFWIEDLEWRVTSFECGICGKKVRGLENLVEGERRGHECLRGVVQVWEDVEIKWN